MTIALVFGNLLTCNKNNKYHPDQQMVFIIRQDALDDPT